MKQFYAILALAIFMAGCVISPRRTVGGTPGGGGGTPGSGGQLYVTTANSILRFSNAETATGNVAPTATITSAAFSSLQRLIVDTANDRLYVVSQGTKSILIFDNASTLSGNVTPTRAISGNQTQLSSPLDIALDPNNNILYVADGFTIFIYGSASTVNGNVVPASAILIGTTIGGLALDATNDQLYFSDSPDNVIDRLDNANLQTGTGIVGGQIAGPDTKLSQPRGLVLDSSGRLLVSNTVAPISITTYANASAAAGNIAPFGNITGSSTLLQSPQQMAINNSVSNGELYVADPTAGSILIFTNVSTTQGNLAPTRNITGSSTGLAVNAINGLALDTTR
jgi:DNA-binding beta-propeller fold protein YncE